MKRWAIFTIFISLPLGMLNAQMKYNALPEKILNESQENETANINPFQNLTNLDIFLSASDHNDSKKEEYKSEFYEFIEKQRSKNSDDQNYFLKNLFYKVHNKYLKHYKNLVTFNDIFEKGNYDCVTGTALYALILEELGYGVRIYESNFHVLLLVSTGNEKILFESTDFYDGFIDDEQEIVQRILYYQNNSSEENTNYYNYQVNNNQFINSRQLAGLLFFNLAVEQYNLHNLKLADNYLQNAELLYQSSRTEELRSLIEKASLINVPLSFKN